MISRTKFCSFQWGALEKAWICRRPDCEFRYRPIWPEDWERPPVRRCGRRSKRIRRPPGTLRRARNYAEAVARWVAAGRPVRPRSEQRRIRSICRECPGGHYRFAQQPSWWRRLLMRLTGGRLGIPRPFCVICGCGLSQHWTPLADKLAMATEGCPKGYWPPVH